MTALSCKHKGKRGQRLFEHEVYSGVIFTNVHFTPPDSHIFFRDTMIECLEELRHSYLQFHHLNLASYSDPLFEREDTVYVIRCTLQNGKAQSCLLKNKVLPCRIDL